MKVWSEKGQRYYNITHPWQRLTPAFKRWFKKNHPKKDWNAPELSDLRKDIRRKFETATGETSYKGQQVTQAHLDQRKVLNSLSLEEFVKMADDPKLTVGRMNQALSGITGEEKLKTALKKANLKIVKVKNLNRVARDLKGDKFTKPVKTNTISFTKTFKIEPATSLADLNRITRIKFPGKTFNELNEGI